MRNPFDPKQPEDQVPRRAAQLLSYDSIKAFAKELGRPASTLIALAPARDPFSITPLRLAEAKWFAGLYKRFGFGSGVHLRRIHYRIISQKKPVKMVDAMAYENTEDCWEKLMRISNAARYLDLVPAEDFEDRRNDAPMIYLPNDFSDAALELFGREPYVETFGSGKMPYLPSLRLTTPKIAQRYHVEIWCEKTTINEILEQVGSDYGCNIVTGSGDLSNTACVNLVERAEQSGLPVRILYISDFDNSGQPMPVAVARKIEHRLARKNLDLDIQLRPIALTFEQCRAYRLPRTPMKFGHPGVGIFEERFGKGATELDALEALHPGELLKIIEGEVERYYDPGLYQRVRDTALEIQGEIATITAAVHRDQRAEIKALESQWQKMTKERARLAEEWKASARPVWRAIAKSLEAEAPDPDAIDWPEPDEGDEDSDPLFDSLRDYLEQINRYKKYQDKPIKRRGT